MARPRNSDSMFPPGFSDSSVGPIRGTLSELPRALRTLLVADGTVTKLLEAFFWETIGVRVTSQEVVREDPFGVGEISDVIHRVVVIENAAQKHIYACATSKIVLNRLAPDVREALMHEHIGMGALLRAKRLETYREHRGLHIRDAGPTDAPLLETTPDSLVVEREYRIHTNSAPFVNIREVFPIARYIG